MKRQIAALVLAFPVAVMAAGVKLSGVRPTTASGPTVTFYDTFLSPTGCSASITAATGQTVSTARATPATVFNGSTLATCSSNQIRVDADGLLAEDAATNLEANPEAMGSWTATLATVSSNSITAPDGSATADRISGSGAGGMLEGTSLVASGVKVHFSAFLKVPVGASVTLAIRNTTDGNDYASATHTVTASWGLFTVSGAASATAGKTLKPRIIVNSEVVDAWGAMYEEGTTLSTYAAVNRNRDAITFTNPLITGTSWCVRGTYKLRGAWGISGVTRYLFSLGNLGFANTAGIQVISNGNLRVFIYDAASGEKRIDWSSPGFAADSSNTVTLCSTAGGVAKLYNAAGTEVGTSSGAGTGVIGTMPNTIYVGGSPGNSIRGWVKNFSVNASADPLLLP